MTELRTNGARLAAAPISEGGTPAEVWTGSLRSFPVLDVDDCTALVLVAAHPDDETLGLGAAAAMLVAREVNVQVVAVTDGEGAYPGRDRASLAKERRAELIEATGRLGLPKPVFLRLPDGDVASHEQRLIAKLAAVLARFDGGVWCAATWRGDGHPDHEATGRAAAAAARVCGAVFVEYPIWMWHWAIPDDTAVPWHRVRRIAVTTDAVDAKAAALQCFPSQTEAGDDAPIVSAAMIARQMAVGEIVFV